MLNKIYSLKFRILIYTLLGGILIGTFGVVLYRMIMFLKKYPNVTFNKILVETFEPGHLTLELFIFVIFPVVALLLIQICIFGIYKITQLLHRATNSKKH